jgi:hypothetical protein
MSELLIIYAFHKIDKPSLENLIRLKKINPNTTIIPFFGVKQRFYLPTIINFNFIYYLGPRAYQYLIWPGLKSSKVYKFSYQINRFTESNLRKDEFKKLKELLNRYDFETYFDYTPLGYRNLDLALVDWYKNNGSRYDFSHVVFYEYDTYSNMKIAKLYDKYGKYDASFINYRRVTEKWLYYRRPPGATNILYNWLIENNYKKEIYGCLFACNMLSRKCFEDLVSLDYTEKFFYGYCECRLPTVLTARGHRCASLEFPFVRFRPMIKSLELRENIDAGIFHPAYNIRKDVSPQI